MRASEPVDWVFDPLPASGARRGGDAASHVFRQNVTSFVREVVQNANDQRTGAPEIHFRFLELEGDKLTRFLAAAAWPRLEPHLRAAASTRGGRHLNQFLEDFDRRPRLLVLIIEDRNTVGLTGDEFEGDSHFRALCKDTLFSHKQTESAGGSFGLGKSVLWTFSGLSTVLFNSTLSTATVAGQQSPRLFGRVELPTHELPGTGRTRAGFAGSGWFGRRMVGSDGERAESLWAERAAAIAGELGLSRRDAAGTSIAILGFRDPTADADRSVDDLAREIATSVERDFWPAMVMPGEPLTVWTGRAPRPLLPERDLDLVRPFVDAYRQRTSTRTALDAAGDVVVRDIQVDVPGRNEGGPAVKGHVRLCVRLFADDDQATHPLAGHVAWFRRPGMVVWYGDKRRLALGARPFHAVVACGEARAPEAPTTEADRAIERFLRAAEPPGHDTWESTAALKADYKRGYAKALELMQQRVDDALRQIVVAQPRRGRQGPDRLRKMFPLGKRGGTGGGPAAFQVRRMGAWLEGGRWRFRGEIFPSSTAAAWECTLRLTVSGEDGSDVEPIAIERVETAVVAEVDLCNGVATVQVTGPLLVFTGESVSVPATAGGRRAVTLEAVSRVSGAR